MIGIQVGDRVPPFELPDQDGQTVRFESLLGRGPIVLYFYPRDETPGCTTQACGFRDANADFAAAGATVVGVSSDSVASHRQFADKHGLRFTLLADQGGKVRGLIGIPKQVLGLMDGRVTLIVDREGIVRHRFDFMLRVQRHVNEALEVVRHLAP